MAGSGPQDGSDDLTAIDKRRPGAGSVRRLLIAAGETRLRHSDRWPAQNHTHVRGDSHAPRVSNALAVEEKHIRLGRDACHGVEDGRAFTEGQQARNIGKHNRAIAVHHLQRLKRRKAEDDHGGEGHGRVALEVIGIVNAGHGADPVAADARLGDQSLAHLSLDAPGFGRADIPAVAEASVHGSLWQWPVLSAGGCAGLVLLRDPWHTPAVPKHNYFDEPVAARYDETSADMFQPDVLDPAISFLADLAGDGPALEFGVGTGRIALPLSQRGVPIHGIDLSAAMIEQLRAKPGADAIGVTVGDAATTRVSGTFRLVYMVWNTIMNLTTQDEQVACFQNAAAHLEPGGCFVVEVMVPELRRLSPGETVCPFTVTPTRLGFDEYDIASQGLVSYHYRIEGRHVGANHVPFRYVWAAELDLMARIAGMRLRERWGGWKREPFTSDSTCHISVWEKLPT